MVVAKMDKKSEEVPESAAAGGYPPDQGLAALYGALNDRVGDRDQMMWQAPAMAMTAQAFLLTIALGHDTSSFAQFLAALLGVAVTVMSIQLMLKHRFFMATDELLMIALEHRMGMVSSVVDWDIKIGTIYQYTSTASRTYRVPRREGLVNWKSVTVWVVGLALFALVNILILVLAGQALLAVACPEMKGVERQASLVACLVTK